VASDDVRLYQQRLEMTLPVGDAGRRPRMPKAPQHYHTHWAPQALKRCKPEAPLALSGYKLRMCWLINRPSSHNPIGRREQWSRRRSWVAMAMEGRDRLSAIFVGWRSCGEGPTYDVWQRSAHERTHVTIWYAWCKVDDNVKLLQTGWLGWP
jgi:hypothetical protein